MWVNYTFFGKYMITDLSAGPCVWGSEALVSGPLIPYVGDGTQGPSSSTEALGFGVSVEDEDQVEDEVFFELKCFFLQFEHFIIS
jgi:hypothetical protein